jgi:hypothetical protein
MVARENLRHLSIDKLERCSGDLFWLDRWQRKFGFKRFKVEEGEYISGKWEYRTIKGREKLRSWMENSNVHHDKKPRVGGVWFNTSREVFGLGEGKIGIKYGLGKHEELTWSPLEKYPCDRFDTIHSKKQPDGIQRGPVILMGTNNQIIIQDGEDRWRVTYV